MTSPKASIVVLCYNGLEECTTPCVESIFAFTVPGTYELILVDNHSTDGTGAYIQSLASRQSHVVAICNNANLGYAAGNNCGIRAAAYPFVVLLNNDTLVTEEWLESLLAPFAKDEAIALVGPVTNSAGSQQRIDIPGLADEDWRNVAKAYTQANKHRVRECRNLGFFCVAARRSALDVVGLLDENYGYGMFEDDDLCLRMRNGGYKLITTDACFIRHLGSYSFSKLNQVKVRQLFEHNRKLFLNKHGVQWAYTDFVQDIWEAARSDFVELCRDTHSNTDIILGRNHILDAALSYQKHIELSLREERDALQKLLHVVNSSFVLRYALDIRRKYLREGIPGCLKAIRKGISLPTTMIPLKLVCRYFEWMSRSKHRVLFPPLIPWDTPLFRRPQHIVRELAHIGYVYFFNDPVVGSRFVQKENNVYLTPDILSYWKVQQGDILHMYSNQSMDLDAQIFRWLEAGGKILYEYIAEIHPIINGMSITKTTFDRHKRFLEDKSVFVIATATVLYDECVAVRGSTEKILLNPNAAEIDHFALARRDGMLPETLRFVAEKKRRILGYFGALASWFDYSLVKKVAEAIPECEIVIVGPSYDGPSQNMAMWDHVSNLHYLGPVPYKKLPDYAKWFDAAIIPFVINDITLSISPIKLFEYMALGLETVITAMPECRKYPHVSVAESHEEFIRYARAALERSGSPEQREKIIAYARENHSWSARARAIVDFLENEK